MKITLVTSLFCFAIIGFVIPKVGYSEDNDNYIRMLAVTYDENKTKYKVVERKKVRVDIDVGMGEAAQQITTKIDSLGYLLIPEKYNGKKIHVYYSFTCQSPLRKIKVQQNGEIVFSSKESCCSDTDGCHPIN